MIKFLSEIAGLSGNDVDRLASVFADGARQEAETVSNYMLILSQITDEYLISQLKEIIADENNHIDRFRDCYNYLAGTETEID